MMMVRLGGCANQPQSEEAKMLSPTDMFIKHKIGLLTRVERLGRAFKASVITGLGPSSRELDRSVNRPLFTGDC
jgi:hypothetical protein